MVVVDPNPSPPGWRSRESGFLTTELIVAMAILVIAALPLGYSFMQDAEALRRTYQRAVAAEIVDGEMEILVAGEWRALPEGTRPYAVAAKAARNLPPGRFEVTRAGLHLRLAWRAIAKRGIGPVVREVTLK